MQPVEAVVEMAGQAGRLHRVLAWSSPRHPLGLRGPELREAAMLILPAPEGRGDAGHRVKLPDLRAHRLPGPARAFNPDGGLGTFRF
jgi:hypothetical protein